MARTIGIGIQDFSKIVKNDYFYVDKTAFIKEWWESGDQSVFCECERTRYKICQLIENLYSRHSYLLDSDVLTQKDKEYFKRIDVTMNDGDATMVIHQLSDFLMRYYGKKVIILLDEYDTPMQEAYVRGYWDELVAFTRSMFNSM